MDKLQAIKTEIERRIKELVSGSDYGARCELRELLSFIDSLQQKQPEVDIEKEIDNVIEDLEGCAISENGEVKAHLVSIEQLRDFARHFAQWEAEHKYPKIVKGKLEKANITVLMKKPTDKEISDNPCTHARKLEELDYTVRSGKDLLEDDDTVYVFFPREVKEKIEIGKKYGIYFNWHDSADSSDSTTFYRVFYVEEVS